MTSFTERLLGAARLDVQIDEEVEADETALGQAMGVVILSSVAAGVGSSGYGVLGFFVGTVGALIAWFVWAGITSFVGTRLLPEPQTESDIGELLRTTGFSAAPGLLRVFGIVPVVGWLVFPVTFVWMLVAMVVAVRQALDYQLQPYVETYFPTHFPVGEGSFESWLGDLDRTIDEIEPNGTS